uniref:Chromosome partitioning protein parB n=1 Tax=Aliivibrio fischeri TaxID=668 RepID=H2ES68_ALIFS|nr:ParB/RepB/Spo0J family partition protein [Aliivibrio fischeri]AEY78235.1 chromosome partitioning protein parB [Aliivibrio fischeri]
MVSLRERSENFDISQLLDESGVEITDGETIKKIPKDFLYSISQVRTDFDESSLQELALNIKENGQQLPVIVHPLDNTNKYCIHQGERRWRAICLLDEIETVDCLVRTNNTMFQQLSENIQRENLSPYEISAALLNLKSKENIKSVELSHKLGKSKSWTSQYESIAKMPVDLVQSLRNQNVLDINVIANVRKSAQKDLEATLRFVQSGSNLTRESTERFKVKILSSLGMEQQKRKDKKFKSTNILVKYKNEYGIIMNDSFNMTVGFMDILIDNEVVTVAIEDITIIGYKSHNDDKQKV